jgi:hypothetical protein
VQLVEDRASLRRRRREQQRWFGWNAHTVLRARQISSDGHFFAHSALDV